MTASEKYLRLLQNIDEMTHRAGRKDKITLLVVTKGHPWTDVEPVYQAGGRHFGENRLQEAFPKMSEAPAECHWHFIGTLQKNKVRKVVDSFTLIHSVDHFELVEKISQASLEEGVVTSILLQVNTSGELSKHGLSEQGWEKHVEALLTLPAVRIEGLMTMAPLTEDETKIRDCFADLRKMRDRLQPHFRPHHPFQQLSMGMSHDYPIAIEEGATLLRIGSAIFH